MRLQRLAPRLATVDTRRLPVLETKAGATPRTRGEAWMKTRRQVLLAGGFACVDCGAIAVSNEVDHDTPLEQGGTDDLANLKVRCPKCHKAKTATETKQRFGKY